MTKAVHERFVRAYWLSALADTTLEEVTLGEITAGTRLEKMTVDGLGSSPTNNKASVVLMDTEQIAEAPGTRSQALTMKFVRDTVEGEDVSWEMFDHGTPGFLVVCRLRVGDPVAGDRVEIYKGGTFEPQPMAATQDTYQQYDVEVAVEAWEIKATVVAGS